MKVVLFLLFVIYLSTSTVTSLKCYTCLDATNNADCNANAPTTCTSTTAKCSVAKVAVSLFGKSSTILNKGCIESALCTGSINILFVASGTECCDTDLCNVNGSVNFCASKLLIIASASILYFIYKLTN
ncbi:prostate stem cell antigen [Amblyraja radiata]|uniref:prostate stem cell antigen n=1 Tax=Amblyraja radiata TaxID=386614 RepID=UPI001402924A|nr:prostate stem cell antigen [Amblyraja radiata]